MGLTTNPTCWRCQHRQREANYGGYFEHSERECFEALNGHIRLLEAKISVLAQVAGVDFEWYNTGSMCRECDRPFSDHPWHGCAEFMVRE